jgi:ribonuclease PH
MSKIEFDINSLIQNQNFEIPISEILKPLEEKNEKIENETPNNINCTEIEIKDCSSSIYFNQGETNLLISIYGPKETKFRDKVKNEESNIEIYVKFNKEVNKNYINELNDKIKNFSENIILTQSYPKCQINITINILSSNNNDFILLSVIYNGIMMALCLSGIDLQSMCLSKSFYNLNNDSSILICIDANEKNNILFIENDKSYSSDEYDKLVNETNKGIEIIYLKMKNFL